MFKLSFWKGLGAEVSFKVWPATKMVASLWQSLGLPITRWGYYYWCTTVKNWRSMILKDRQPQHPSQRTEWHAVPPIKKSAWMKKELKKGYQGISTLQSIWQLRKQMLYDCHPGYWQEIQVFTGAGAFKIEDPSIEQRWNLLEHLGWLNMCQWKVRAPRIIACYLTMIQSW